MVPLVNNFQESIDAKKIEETTREIKAKLKKDAIQTEFCNQLITKIVKSIRTKKGMDGSTCVFSMRTNLYEQIFSYYDVGRHNSEDHTKLCDMLNECFHAHDELKHFKTTTIKTHENKFMPTDFGGSESEAVCVCCICCFCWYPFYCIPVNLVEMAFGKNITYTITLSLVENSKEKDMDDIVSYGIPYVKSNI